jgi:hypothetical protein
MKTIKDLPRHDMGIIKKTWRPKMRLREAQEAPKDENLFYICLRHLSKDYQRLPRL